MVMYKIILPSALPVYDMHATSSVFVHPHSLFVLLLEHLVLSFKQNSMSDLHVQSFYIPIKYIALLYRHECFTGEYATRKLRTKLQYIQDTSDIFSLSSLVKISMTSLPIFSRSDQ